MQFHTSTAERHCEKLQRNYEANRINFLQLRDEEERYGLVSISESDEAEDLRNRVEAAERSAESARKDLHIMLGTWVDDSVGTSGGDTSAGELRVPLDLQLQSVVEEGLVHSHNLDD